MEVQACTLSFIDVFFHRIKTTLSVGFDSNDTLRVYHNGQIRWLVPLNVVTRCGGDVEIFPFDVQSCPINFIFWITSKEETLVVKLENQEEVRKENEIP